MIYNYEQFLNEFNKEVYFLDDSFQVDEDSLYDRHPAEFEADEINIKELLHG